MKYEPATTTATCECGNPTASSAILCLHCQFDEERKSLEQVYFDGKKSDTVYYLFESIRSACSRSTTPDERLRKVTRHISLTVTHNQHCTDALERLKQLRMDLWELAP